jgi:phosphoribosylanthranilate isomerase
MFRIKICGITKLADALAAAAAGADAIGLNFYPRSKRFLGLDAATEIAASVPLSLKRVGVFVNARATEIAEFATHIPLDAIQLHGDEPPALLATLPQSLPIIRAFRYGDRGLEPLSAILQECQSHGRGPDAILIDADAKQEYGGTGHVVDWSRVAKERSLLGTLPLLMSGGLTPANVALAIQTIRPTGVDVASGVEKSPGNKDATKVREFIAAARAAFEALESH